MDGQLGREETTSQLSPVTFVIRDPAEEVRLGAVLWLQGGAADKRKQPKVKTSKLVVSIDRVMKIE